MGDALDCYNNWKSDWNQAKSSQESAAATIAEYEPPMLGQDAEYIAAMNNNHNALCEIRTCLEKAINWSMDNARLKGLLYKSAQLWDWGPPPHWPPAGEEYELTWEKIVAAWADADMLGRLWTTLSIDFMRKEVWNEPVTDFALRSGEPSK